MMARPYHQSLASRIVPFQVSGSAQLLNRCPQVPELGQILHLTIVHISRRAWRLLRSNYSDAVSRTRGEIGRYRKATFFSRLGVLINALLFSSLLRVVLFLRPWKTVPRHRQAGREAVGANPKASRSTPKAYHRKCPRPNEETIRTDERVARSSKLLQTTPRP